MLLLTALLTIYIGFIGSRLYHTYLKQKTIKSGDYCSIYMGENKLRGLVVKVNHDVDVWVMNVIIRFSRNDIYT